MKRDPSSTPFISVVIPTRNRARSLRRTLEALRRQTYPADDFEVIAVANDCSDETGAMVRAFAAPYGLRLVECPTAGISLARNTGSSMARGVLLVFLDDDIEPLPDFLAAYARAHTDADNFVAVGPLLPPPRHGRLSFFAERLNRLDVDFSVLRAQEKETLDWTCIAGGNVSVRKALVEKTGGFDISIVSYGGEDYEFAYRAQWAGARFVFVPAAAGYHYGNENVSVASYLRHARLKGRNDVEVARKHPKMVRGLGLGRLLGLHSMRGRLGRSLALDHPQVGDPIAHGLALGGNVLVWLRLHSAWNRLFDYLYSYWYFRGAGDGLGPGAKVAEYVTDLKRAAADDEVAQSRPRQGIK